MKKSIDVFVARNGVCDGVETVKEFTNLSIGSVQVESDKLL